MNAESQRRREKAVTPILLCVFASWRSILLIGILSVLASAWASRAADLEADFRHPPESARPWVFWYWMNAAVSRAGITADLEAMKDAGLGGAYLMPIKGPTKPPQMDPPVEQLSPQWWEMVRHAM